MTTHPGWNQAWRWCDPKNGDIYEVSIGTSGSGEHWWRMARTPYEHEKHHQCTVTSPEALTEYMRRVGLEPLQDEPGMMGTVTNGEVGRSLTAIVQTQAGTVEQSRDGRSVRVTDRLTEDIMVSLHHAWNQFGTFFENEPAFVILNEQACLKRCERGNALSVTLVWDIEDNAGR